VWFLFFALGAATLHLVHLPAAAARFVTVLPPPEAAYALYFLAAALARFVIRDVRVAALERGARREARRARRPLVQPPGLMDVGVGVGKGVAQVALGSDLLGAAMTGAALLLRLAASRPVDRAALVRRASERRRAIAWEGRRAVACVLAVGLVCVAASWAPIARPRVVAAAAALRARLPARYPFARQRSA
jgi:hypothetical protein